MTLTVSWSISRKLVSRGSSYNVKGWARLVLRLYNNFHTVKGRDKCRQKSHQPMLVTEHRMIRLQFPKPPVYCVVIAWRKGPTFLAAAWNNIFSGLLLMVAECVCRYSSSCIWDVWGCDCHVWWVPFMDNIKGSFIKCIHLNCLIIVAFTSYTYKCALSPIPI